MITLAVLCFILFCFQGPIFQDVEGSSRGEKACRDWLENRFGRKFVRVRPDWLKNPRTGKNLELDCYNEELKLAVEYNGEQHYRRVEKFKNNLKYTRYKDSLKKNLCAQNDIHLIVVPYNVKIDEYLSKEITNWGGELKYRK